MSIEMIQKGRYLKIEERCGREYKLILVVWSRSLATAEKEPSLADSAEGSIGAADGDAPSGAPPS